MKIKNIALLFLLVSSFGNANEKNRDSEGLMLHLYPKNICDDPFALEPDSISIPSEDPFAESLRKVDALLAGEPTAPPPEPKKLADASAASLKLPCKTAFGTESNVAIFDVKLLAPFLIGLGNLL